jgi:hypothetical protein
MGFNQHELMDFKKFAQSIKGLLYSDETIFLYGTFKEGDNIIEGDNFTAHIVKKSGEKLNIDLIYKTYIEWFNYTRNPDEKERVFVSVKLEELKQMLVGKNDKK